MWMRDVRLGETIMSASKNSEKQPAASQVPARFELAEKDLRWRCDPRRFSFSCTDELKPPAGFVGQGRAGAALEVGLGVTRPGFNIFVTGLTGTGRTPVVMSHLTRSIEERQKSDGRPTISDWCYVFDFATQEHPRALKLPGGEGALFEGRVTEILETLTRDLRNAFNSEAYQNEVKRLNEEAIAGRQALMVQTERFAFERGFAIEASPVGISVIPLARGKPMEQAELMALSDAGRADLDRRRKEITRRVEDTMEQVQEAESARQNAALELTSGVAERAVKFPFEALTSHYRELPHVLEFLENLREYTLTHVPVFLQDGPGERDGAPAAQGPRVVQDPLLPFRINVFVAHDDARSVPVVEENNPTYPNMFGHIERRPFMGTYVTDHTMLRAGAMVRASGGYLVVQARDILRQPGVWEALKRTLRAGQTRPEDPSEAVMPGLIPQSLRPEPIPIDVKVIMIGDDYIYQALAAFDEDFWENFKVRADFDNRMENNQANIEGFAALICGMVERHELRHADRTGVGEIIEHGARIAGDRTKLSTRFGFIRDILIEADYWAEQSKSRLINARHVRKALDHRVYRTSRVSDAIQELIARDVIMVDLEGEKVGQVNGLSVYNLGDVSFGKPTRITAQTFMGRQGVVNIEREARLSGSTHDKGVLIMSGLLGARYAQEFPLSLNVSLAFEQSYEGIDGDSASSTELYAILSSLSGLPISQGLAVTGSVNQMGEIQAIGGVNEKIEGYFDVCREAGKLGASVGVMIPRANVSNLALRHDIITAVRKGQFRVLAIETVDEGISLLTGKPAGALGRGGKFPAGSVNALVQARLRALAEGMRAFSDRPR